MNAGNAESPAACRASVLLEVLLAVAILTLGMATVGIQINRAYDMEVRAAEITTRMNVLESVLAQLRAIQREAGVTACGEKLMDIEIEGSLRFAFPGYAYRIYLEPSRIEGMDRFTIELLQGEIDENTGEFLDFDVPRVSLARVLCAGPTKINADAVNMSEKDRNLLSMNGLIDDEGNFCIDDLLALNAEELIDVLPQMLALSQVARGGNAAQYSNMTPEQLLDLLDAQQAARAGGGLPGGFQPPAGAAAEGRDAGSGQGTSDEPDWSQTSPTGGLTQEQLDWMLEQLVQKQRERNGQ
jgi:hypothetical protein